MSSAQPKFSVLIPTRNGGDYLKAAVTSVLSQDFDSYELIVSVNDSNDGSLEYLQGLENKHLRIVQPPKACSMTANFEYGLGQMQGEWLIIFGDDDAMLSGCFSKIQSILEDQKFKSVKALSFARALYFWPGCESMWGPIALSYHADSKINVKSTKKALLQTLFGLSNYYVLPEMYTNKVVHSSVVSRALAMSGGSFYKGIGPDSYSGVLVSLMVDKYLEVGEPVFLTGTSPKSNGLSNIVLNSGASEQNPEEALLLKVREFYEKSEADGYSGSSEVSLALWRLADYVSIYTLYALGKIPFFNQKFGRYAEKWMRIFQYIAYASLLVNLRNSNNLVLRKSILHELNVLIIKSKLSRTLIGIYSFLVGCVSRLNNLIINMQRKLSRFTSSIPVQKIESYDRDQFPCIASAISAIAAIKDKG
jgi:glycosyltransferase involved in cell wall biosynthesis